MKLIPRNGSYQSSLRRLLVSVILIPSFAICLFASGVQAHQCQSDQDCFPGYCNLGVCQTIRCDLSKNGSDCPYADNACIVKTCEHDEGDLTISYCHEIRAEGAACALDRDCGLHEVCNTQTCECESDQPPTNLCVDVNCDDQDPCTSDPCDEKTGLCQHSRIDHCPAPIPPNPPVAPDTTQAEAKVTPNPCVTSFSAQGLDEGLANSLAAQGICSLSLTGQSARACSLVVTSETNPWPMLVPIMSGLLLMVSQKMRRK